MSYCFTQETWDRKKKIKDKATISEGIMRGTGEFYVNMTPARVVLEERTAIEKTPLPDWPLSYWLLMLMWEAHPTMGDFTPG